MPLSRSRVDRAGSRTRSRARLGQRPLDEDIGVIEEFRAAHLPTALIVQNMLLQIRSRYVAALPPETRDGELGVLGIASRPKTAQAIIAKIGRSTTRLSDMQDIVGGRITVPTMDIQDRVMEGLVQGFVGAGTLPPSVKDTRANGDALGYRAIHVVARLGGRNVEIQVRTLRQDRWAQTVEDLDRVFGTDLKHGDGPTNWLQWLRELSVQLHRADLGLEASIPEPPSSNEESPA